MLRARYSQMAGNGPRYVRAPEVRNQAGFGGYGGDGRLRACDLIVCDTWPSGPLRLIGHELKCSRTDWKRELEDPDKAGAFLPYVAEWWLVVSDRKIVRDGELPLDWGLLAPAGNTLRAVFTARRKPAHEVQPMPLGMIAAMLRSVQGVTKNELERAKQPRSVTLGAVPMSATYDRYPYDADFTDIRQPDYAARRRA